MSKKFMVFLVGAFVLVGLFFFWTLYGGLQGATGGGTTGSQSAAPGPPAPPPPPSVNYSVVTSRSGNSFQINWCNLPENTVALDILRKLKSGETPWELWKQIKIEDGSPSCASASFNIGYYTFAAYTFNIEAVGNITGTAGNITGQKITWSSGPGTAPVTASTTSAISSNTNTSGTNTANTNTSSSTQTNTNSSTSTATATSSPASGNTTTASTTSSSGTSSATPSGTPYYNPQIQLNGYGLPPQGNFWVEYVNGKIEIGWQDLPTSTNSIAILRGASDSGPWTTILAQSDINPTGPSTIQIVDNTLDQTSYYELEAESGSNIVASYGPVSLPPLSQ